MNKILSITLLIATLVCSAYSQSFTIAMTDSALTSAIKNRNYAATIVNYMTSGCSRSRYIKVLLIVR